MYYRIHTVSTYGSITNLVRVEVDILSTVNNPRFDIVGLPSKSIAEAKERVVASIKNIGLPFPHKKITVNLSPADIPKDGTGFDLPIALAILSANKLISPPEDTIYWGELTLDGRLIYTQKAFIITLTAKENNYKIVLPHIVGLKEAFYPDNQFITEFNSLSTIVQSLNTNTRVKMPYSCVDTSSRQSVVDLKDNSQKKPLLIHEVIGQDTAKKALLISLIGKHNILMMGPPGVGKTMLMKSGGQLLPKLEDSDFFDVNRIHSSSNLLTESNPIQSKEPFRTPHYSISNAGLIGGGSVPKPGEISLAHKGILFLDEMTEFSRVNIEGLRQPLEDKEVVISRSRYSVKFPADFTLWATANPCPCGYLGDGTDRCKCSESSIEKYRNKISGPIKDRIDMNLYLNRYDKNSDVNIETINKFISNIRILRKQYKELETIRQKKRQKEMLEIDLLCKTLGKSDISYRKLSKVSRLGTSYLVYNEKSTLSKEDLMNILHISGIL